jgi:hypothetical protein
MLAVSARYLSVLGEKVLNSVFVDFGKSYCAISQGTGK